MKPAHHRGDYQVRARLVVARARLYSSTRCWRCGRTLDEHPPHRNGRPAFWTAGHVIDGDVRSPLLPEVSTCNFRAGGKRKHVLARRRNGNPTSRQWFN